MCRIIVISFFCVILWYLHTTAVGMSMTAQNLKLLPLLIKAPDSCYVATQLSFMLEPCFEKESTLFFQCIQWKKTITWIGIYVNVSERIKFWRYQLGVKLQNVSRKFSYSESTAKVIHRQTLLMKRETKIERTKKNPWWDS